MTTHGSSSMMDKFMKWPAIKVGITDDRDKLVRINASYDWLSNNDIETQVAPLMFDGYHYIFFAHDKDLTFYQLKFNGVATVISEADRKNICTALNYNKLYVEGKLK